ncbi:MAG: dihydroorotase [Clostridia bacterium]|nr:dihydroorotase [Clostridia bacterium]
MAVQRQKNIVSLPGFVDVHVHFREPGFSYKETMLTGAKAALKGGYRAVCTMPNLDPVPDSPEKLLPQLKLIAEAEAAVSRKAQASGKKAQIRILPYGSLTVDEKGEKLSAMEALSPYVIAFSDDGKGVQSREIMRSAMYRAKALGKIIAAHCEDNSLLRGGYIHDGTYAKAHGHKGISSESEWRPIERDLELAAETGAAYHVCHISTKESVELIRQAKKSGVNVSCETAPHYLLLTDEDLEEDGRFKMNPPLRSPDDRDALIEGIKDGTIDMIATDHAPHSAEEKSRGLKDSLFGIVGLEIAFPLLYTYLVLENVIPLEKLTELMSYAPAKRFGITQDGEKNNLWDLDAGFTVDSRRFSSMGKATPFDGRKLKGKLIS